MHTIEQLRAGELVGIRRLNLSCDLQEFPEEIFTLADSLEILDLSRNKLTLLPDDLPRLHKLRVLFCSDNLFTRLPEVLGRCPQLSMVGFKANSIRQVSAAALPQGLRWLILTDNQIETLPPELGRCAQLQKLMLAGNRLRDLPEQLSACTRLELLRIAANRFQELPEWLLGLPRLAWLAYAGNPFCADSEAAALENNPVAAITWSDLEIQQKLGEGASGVIYRALWRDAAESPMAVKLFKGALTSDGLPYSEMAGCIAAGSHPNLIPVRGKIREHPEGASGLVMSLVDASFKNLAAPPSLDSCTRDIYADGTKFSLVAVLGIASGIADAVRHLHERGILHGDLYAHNILHGNVEHALLGDFGAASSFEPGRGLLALALQRIEVRAFSCLLEELLEYYAGNRDDDAATLVALEELQVRCASADMAQRPLFGEIAQLLNKLREQQA